MQLPAFDELGCLPPGDYPMTLSQLRESMLVLGPSDPADCPSWDAAWRSRLVDNAEILIRELWQVGITKVFLDGFFVEDKDHPNDIDGYFECSFDELASGRLQSELNRINPFKIWTWDPESRRKYPGFAKLQLPMWLQYRVEFYPHAVGIMSGIVDEWGNDLGFPAAFRRSRRDGRLRGIVQIVAG
jgi:hypothetical protein